MKRRKVIKSKRRKVKKTKSKKDERFQGRKVTAVATYKSWCLKSSEWRALNKFVFIMEWNGWRVAWLYAVSKDQGNHWGLDPLMMS